MIKRCWSSLPGATNGAILIFKFNDFVSATEKMIVACVAPVQRLSRSAMLQPYQRYFSDSLAVARLVEMVAPANLRGTAAGANPRFVPGAGRHSQVACSTSQSPAHWRH